MAGARVPRLGGRKLGSPGRARAHERQPVRWWVRHRLWLPPVVAALLGGCLGVLLVSPPPAVARLLSGVAWRATTSEARSMLSAALGIVLTSLSIVLSLSMLVIQNAAGQYSPRLLRLYLHSAGIRVVIPVFVATSVFCLAAAQGFGFVPEAERVPRPALGLAMLLLVVCEGALVFQVLQTLQLMRVEHLVRRVRLDTLATARTLERSRAADTAAPLPVRAREDRGLALRAPRSGFIAAVDGRALLEVATEERLVVHLERAVGEPVVRGEDVGWVEEEGPRSRRESVSARVLSTIHLDRWRDEDRDIALGVRQLVDVAIKALSPGINDPYTAVEAVDQLTFLLCELSTMRLGPRVLADAAGRPRVFLRGATLRDYLVLATDQVLRFGVAEPAVVLRLLRLVAAVGQRARDAADRDAARGLLDSILATSERAQPDAPWQPMLRRHAADLERALGGGPWPPLPIIGF